MSNQLQQDLAKTFFDQLKNELLLQANEINQSGNDSFQDGFSTRLLDDGWVTYKGFSCGLALHLEPIFIMMSFGPDSPFVGYSVKLEQSIANDGVQEWSSEQLAFKSAADLSNFVLRKLSEKAHDSLSDRVEIADLMQIREEQKRAS